MNNSKFLTVICLIMGLSLLTVSCGDDPASANEDPPEFPTFEKIAPDVSYFEQSISTDSPAFTAYAYASSVSYMSQLGMIYTSYFSNADRDEANYDDGTWTWDYNYSSGGESVSVLLISEERVNEIYWSMTWSYSGTEESFEDYTMFEGTIAKDNSYGSWKFNDLNTETGEHYPLMETTWSQTSETESEIETSMYEQGSLIGSYLYERTGAEHLITYNPNQQEGEAFVIYWNEEIGNGYVQDDDGKRCWNGDFEEVSCS